MLKVYGVGASPYVRKVRAALLEKNVPYELKIVFPGDSSEEYRAISPLGKIPALADGDFTVPDSSVICAYIEKIHPEPALYPADPKELARALWFEEYGDTALAEVLTLGVFFQKVARVLLRGEQPDMDVVNEAVNERAPGLFDYLQGQLGDRDFLVGDSLTIADIGVATQFVNFAHAGYAVDAERWPKLAAYVDRILGRESFKALIEEEKAALPPPA
ncbi:MAG: glutathione S-transferase family protein [Deltaproteobacteria bacterium]|nr:MAG: glutathione S-transferase family protein [Deltaproteobacteria bacterium]